MFVLVGKNSGFRRKNWLIAVNFTVLTLVLWSVKSEMFL